MKRLITICLSLLFVTLFSQFASAADWSYDFESASDEIGGGHSDLSLTLNGIKWTSYALRAGDESADFKNGKASARIYGGKMSMKKMPFFEMAQDKEGGVGTVTFVFAAYSNHTDSQVEWILQASKDGGSHWNTVGAPFKPTAKAQNFSAEVNYPEGRMRIVRADYQTFDPAKAYFSAAFNIDDLSITDSKEVDPNQPELTVTPEALDFGQIFVDETKKLSFTLNYKNLTDAVKVTSENLLKCFQLSATEIQLSEGGESTLDVTFAPTVRGEYRAVLTLTSGELSATVTVKGKAERKPGDYTFSGGTGTAEDPYQLSTAADLADLAYAVDKERKNYKDIYFQVTQDIDCSSVENFLPIGNNFGDNGYNLRPFSGHFDGQHHVISNLKMNYSGPAYLGVGLFGYTEGAEIKNVVIEQSDIRGDAAVGSLVGVANGGSVSNCHVGSIVEVSSMRKSYVGGLMGAVMDKGCTISDCTNRAYVYCGQLGLGGILGINATSTATTISRCANYGELQSQMGLAGGILGYIESGHTIVKDCVNMGTVTSNDQIACGIVGSLSPQQFGPLNIYHCYNYGALAALEDTTDPITIGQLQEVQQISVENCYYCTDNYSQAVSSSIGLSLTEMQTVLVDKLNSNRTDEGPWKVYEGFNYNMPLPFYDKNATTGIEDVWQDGGQPTVTVEGGLLHVEGAYEVECIYDLQGRVYSASTLLPSGIYVVVLSEVGAPEQKVTIKVFNR